MFVNTIINNDQWTWINSPYKQLSPGRTITNTVPLLNTNETLSIGTTFRDFPFSLKAAVDCWCFGRVCVQLCDRGAVCMVSHRLCVNMIDVVQHNVGALVSASTWMSAINNQLCS